MSNLGFLIEVHKTNIKKKVDGNFFVFFEGIGEDEEGFWKPVYVFLIPFCLLYLHQQQPNLSKCGCAS